MQLEFAAPEIQHRPVQHVAAAPVAVRAHGLDPRLRGTIPAARHLCPLMLNAVPILPDSATKALGWRPLRQNAQLQFSATPPLLGSGAPEGSFRDDQWMWAICHPADCFVSTIVSVPMRGSVRPSEVVRLSDMTTA